jgi:hypothetical protein
MFKFLIYIKFKHKFISENFNQKNYYNFSLEILILIIMYKL